MYRTRTADRRGGRTRRRPESVAGHAHLGIPEGTVKSRIHHARTQVRGYLPADL